MKTLKLLTTFALSLLIVACSDFDDSELWKELNSLKDRVTSIEKRLSQMNGDIASLKDLVSALEDRTYITSMETTEEGCVLHFSNGETALIKNGKDGVNGTNGADAPIINIRYDNGEYYWTQTVNGTTSWLLDEDGNRISASGKDAVTPLLQVNADGYWLISYDGGYTYSLVLNEHGYPVKAVGKDGVDGTDGVNGTDGADGDSFFQSVEVVDNELLIVLNDGTEIVLPIGAPSPYKAIDLGLSVKWANFNVGATTATERGILYLWGDPENKGINGLYEAPDVDNICGNQYFDTAKNIWKGKWRMPSMSEQIELVTQCTWTSAVINGVSGMKVTGQNGNYIFLPCTGIGFPSSGIYGQDNTKIINESNGYYWVGESYFEYGGRFAYVFYFDNGIPYYNGSWNTMAVRVAIRAVK